jgi:uncharacterized SAM-binding protein YcdF (DUF218 family)
MDLPHLRPRRASTWIHGDPTMRDAVPRLVSEAIGRPTLRNIVRGPPGKVVGLMFLVWLATAYALDRHGLRGPRGRFDAIVVAGCRVMPDGRPSPALARRAALATQLWRDGLAPRVVFTGGVGDHGGSEASVAASFARGLGLPGDAIVLEERSTSTDENAAGAAEVLDAAGLPRARILVVTDSYHVLRCERVFGRRFAEVEGTGSRGVPLARFRGAMREVPALIAYAALGRL